MEDGCGSSRRSLAGAKSGVGPEHACVGAMIGFEIVGLRLRAFVAVFKQLAHCAEEREDRAETGDPCKA
jgi:hypothetical protein